MNKKVKVSISCITFNHEKFIAQAIESFLMQEVDFDYEIVIGDDGSTDNTKTIIRAYSQKYPDKIRFIDRTKNIGSVANFMQSIKACKGTYVALCEGDDYWTEPKKLMRQVQFLDNNPDYILCGTRYLTKDCTKNNPPEEAELLRSIFKDEGNYEVTKDSIFDPYALKTLTVMFRNGQLDQALFRNNLCGDVFIFSNLLLKGKGMILNFFGGVYQLHPGGIFSQKKEYEKALIEYQRINAMFSYYKGTYGSINRLFYYKVADMLRLVKQDKSTNLRMLFFKRKLKMQLNKIDKQQIK